MNRLTFLLAVLLAAAIALGPHVILPVKAQCFNKPPVAEFTYFPPFPSIYEVITFDASASYDPDGFIFSYRWEFGDGNVTLVTAPIFSTIITHFYVSPGEYNVTLLVTDNLGATDWTTKTLFVKTRVIADFSYSPQFPYVDEPVNFDASNSTGGDGAIVDYTWDFGDGNMTSVTSPVIVHFYTAPGLYNVTLNVTGSIGEWDTKSEVLNVTVSPKIGPEAAFVWTPTTPGVGQTVEFDASASVAGSGKIVSYLWDFGDGATTVSDEPISTHSYQNFGAYVVLLNVTNSDELSDGVSHSVTVVEKPVAGFFFVPDQPRVCVEVTFNASISDPRGGQIVSYEWSFGDNSSVELGEVVTHRFRGMGEYVVVLNVTDSEGFSDMESVRLRVFPHIADLNEDGVVNILDIALFAKAFRSFPGEDRYNPRADLDGNGFINIVDGVGIARSFNMCAIPIDP